MIFGIAFYNSLPGYIAAGMADCELKRSSNVLPAQGTQLTAPQPGGNRHGVIGFVQNRLVHNNLQQSLHLVLLRNMLFLFLRTSLAGAVRGVERNNVVFLGILQHRGNGFKILLHGAFFYSFPCSLSASA